MHTTPTSNPTGSLAFGELCLGLTLGPREVGIALLSSEHLVVFRVVNLRKIASHEGRERRFCQVLDDLLDTFPVTRIAWSRLDERPQKTLTLVENQELAIGQAARTRQLASDHVDRDKALDHLLPDSDPKTLYTLAEMLASRFPELREKAPSSEPVPGADHVPELALVGRRLRTSRERYWSRMFLALGIAQTALDLRFASLLPQPPVACPWPPKD